MEIRTLISYNVVMEKITVQYRNLQLSGNVFAVQNKDNMPGVLLIHGWQSGQNRMFALAEELAQKGFVCLTFDLPSHNESDGDVNNLSIKDYLEACVSAYDFLTKISKVNPNNITVIGSSFGSYLGTILTLKRSVKNLVLRVPANYPDKEFEEVKQLRGFEIPEVMDWRSKKLDPSEAMSLKALHEFNGNIFIVESEKDEMVPHQTIQNYVDAVNNKEKLKYLLMKNAPHSLTGHPDFIKQFNQELLNWMETL